MEQKNRRNTFILLCVLVFLYAVFIWNYKAKDKVINPTLPFKLAKNNIIQMKKMTKNFSEETNDFDNYRNVRKQQSRNLSSKKSSEVYSYTSYIQKRAVESKLQWPTLRGCTHYVVTIATNHTFAPCGLLSNPCSGNTWLRYLIESMTGIATGSVYKSKILKRAGYIGEKPSKDCGCTIVQKDHGGSYKRAIVLIRNPYKQIVSFTNYRNGGVKTRVTKKEFSLEEWNNIAIRTLQEWRYKNIKRIKEMETGIVVHYENLQNDKKKELTRILQFLDLPFIKERFECIEKQEYAIFFREKSEKQEAFLRKAYTEELHNIIDAEIQAMDEILKNKGHPPIPYHLYSYYNETSKSDLSIN